MGSPFQSQRVFFWLWLWACLLCGPGCGSPRYYQPQVAVVGQAGLGEAAESLHAILTNARDPGISKLAVAVDHVEFDCERVPFVSVGRGGTTVGHFACPAPRVRLVFTEVESIDIFRADEFLVLRGRGQRSLFTVKTRRSDELYRLADLWAWFRDRAAHETATAVTPLVVEDKRTTSAGRRMPSRD